MDELIRLVEQAEGDLASLSAEDLAALRSGLADGYAEARQAVETDEHVEALRQVAAAVQRVDDELAAREVAASERENALAELDAAVLSDQSTADADAAADEDEDADDADEDDESGEDDDAAAEAAADTDENDASDDDEGGPAPEAATDDSEQENAERAPVRQASGRRPSLASLRGMQQRQRPATDANTATGLAGRIVASGNLAEVSQGHRFSSVDELGASIQRLHADLQVPSPTLRKHYIGRVQQASSPRVVNADEFVGQADAAIIDTAVERTTAMRFEQAKARAKDSGRRVAAGGICAPPQPDYTIGVVGDRGTPFVDSLPTVRSTRPLSFFPWIEVDLGAAAGSGPGARPDGGIGTVTNAQDEAGYGDPNIAPPGEGSIPDGGAAYKDCVRIDCPEPVVCDPAATFKCVTVGNFQAIGFPEYVSAFENVTSLYFDVARDERAISTVVAASKVVTSSPNVWGTARDLLTKIRRLAAHVRSNRHAPNMTFDVRVPAFAAEMIANDIAVSLGNGSDNLRITPAQALGILAASEGIMVDTYNVSAGTTSGGSPTLLPGQDAGALNDWPEEIRVLMWAEGSVFHTTYGELAFGLRETGMRTNDFSSFEEVFEQTCTRSSDLYALDLAVCENGAQGATVAVTCTTP